MHVIWVVMCLSHQAIYNGGAKNVEYQREYLVEEYHAKFSEILGEDTYNPNEHQNWNCKKRNLTSNIEIKHRIKHHGQEIAS